MMFMALYSIEWKISDKKLLGTEYNFRIRVGNYRVVYFLEDDKLLIEIVRVRHRKDLSNLSGTLQPSN